MDKTQSATKTAKQSQPKMTRPPRKKVPVPDEIRSLFEMPRAIELAMRKAIADSSLVLTRGDIRMMVDLYYQMQDFRKRTNQQTAANEKAGEPASMVLQILLDNLLLNERNILKVLDAWTDTDAASAWAKAQRGIGPVIAAGLAAHIDMDVATNPSKIWRFAGMDNPANYTWTKGTKRPWNARLKTLCWKIGDSFCKQSGESSQGKCFYGTLYRQRKEIEVQLNEEGRHAAECERVLATKKIKSTDCRAHYESGRLPPGRVDLRARRRAVKLFLSHWWAVAYEAHYHETPPKPWVIAQGGHSDYVGPDAATPSSCSCPDGRSSFALPRPGETRCVPSDQRIVWDVVSESDPPSGETREAGASRKYRVTHHGGSSRSR